MTTPKNELESLIEIDALLDNLAKEERQRIFNYILSKYHLSGTNIKTIDNQEIEQSKSNNTIALDGITIKQFIASKRPTGFYEQIACLGYYLEKITGLESFNTKDITKANTDARSIKIPNPSMYVNHTQLTYGYLSSVGGGKKALSARGEALVEALPDRDAVKIALDSHPMKRKTIKPKKKNNS